MTYSEACKSLWKQGAAHAKGEALKAMYAGIVAQNNALNAEPVYQWMTKHLGESETELRAFVKACHDDLWLAVTVTLNDLSLEEYHKQEGVSL